MPDIFLLPLLELWKRNERTKTAQLVAAVRIPRIFDVIDNNIRIQMEYKFERLLNQSVSSKRSEIDIFE